MTRIGQIRSRMFYGQAYVLVLREDVVAKGYILAFSDEIRPLIGPGSEIPASISAMSLDGTGRHTTLAQIEDEVEAARSYELHALAQVLEGRR